MKKLPKNKYNLIFLDTETTGLTKEDRMLQLAYKIDEEICNEYFNPGRPINLHAMAVHHITEDLVKDRPKFKTSKRYKTLQDLLSAENSILVAHNASFDIGMLTREGIKVPNWICTKKLAQYLYADDDEIERVNLQYLRYVYDIRLPDAVAHDALGDILILEQVFIELFKNAKKKAKKGGTADKIVERMMDLSMKPTMLKKMPFGKYKGYEIKTVAIADPRYLKWLMGAKEFEEGDSLKYSIEAALEKK